MKSIWRDVVATCAAFSVTALMFLGFIGSVSHATTESRADPETYGFFNLSDNAFICFLDSRIDLNEARRLFPAIKEYAKQAGLLWVNYPVTAELLGMLRSQVGGGSGPGILYQQYWHAPDSLYVTDNHQGSHAYSSSYVVEYPVAGFGSTTVNSQGQPLPDPNNAFAAVRMYKSFSVEYSGKWAFFLTAYMNGVVVQHTSEDHAHLITGLRVAGVKMQTWYYDNLIHTGSVDYELWNCNLQTGRTYEFAYLNDFNSQGYVGKTAYCHSGGELRWLLCQAVYTP